MTEQIETGFKKDGRRGMGQRSLDLINAMYAIGETAQPITGRGIGSGTCLPKICALATSVGGGGSRTSHSQMR